MKQNTNTFKEKISLERLPIGVKYLKEKDMPKDFNTVCNPEVRSYCDAVRLLQEDEYKNGIIVTLDSIKACKWCPVCLGLKKPETGLEKKIELLFDELNQGVHIFNTTNGAGEPDVVSLISDQENVVKIIDLLGLENFTKEHIDQIYLSALSLYTEVEYPSKRAQRKRKRHLRSIKFFKWLFASKLIRNKPTDKFLTFLLKRYAFSRMMDPILSKFSSGTSLCYNAGAIPFVAQKANVTFPCTGGIAWGDISKDSMLIGVPYLLFKKLEPSIVLPSKETKM